MVEGKTKLFTLFCMNTMQYASRSILVKNFIVTDSKEQGRKSPLDTPKRMIREERERRRERKKGRRRDIEREGEIRERERERGKGIKR